MSRWLIVLGAFAFWLLTVAPAFGQSSRVVVLRPKAEDELLAEAHTRLDAELRAAGFAVIERRAAADSNLREQIERAARDADAFAAITLATDSHGSTTDVWVADRATGKTVVRSVQVARPGEKDAAATIAIRAVELLRASLLEAAVAEAALPEQPLPALPKDVRRWVSDRRRPPAPLEGLSLRAGAAMLHSFGGIGPAWGPVLGLSYGLPFGGAARVSVIAPTVAPDLESHAGSARVRQEIGMVEALFARPLSRTRLVPSASLALGVYHLGAQGLPAPPLRPRAGELWALLMGAGAGLGVRLGDYVVSGAEVQALFTHRRPIVIMAGTQLGWAGRPSWLVTLNATVQLAR